MVRTFIEFGDAAVVALSGKTRHTIAAAGGNTPAANADRR
jgi:hypothetical protein